MSKKPNPRSELLHKLKDSDKKVKTTVRLTGRARYEAYKLARRHRVSIGDVYEAAVLVVQKYEADLLLQLHAAKRRRSEIYTKRRAIMEELDAMSPLQLTMLEQIVGAGANVKPAKKQPTKQPEESCKPDL